MLNRDAQCFNGVMGSHEQAYEGAWAEALPNENKEFRCGAARSVRRSGCRMAHCIAAGMEGKPGAATVRRTDSTKDRRDSQGTACYREFHLGRSTGQDSRPGYSPMSGCIRSVRRGRYCHALGVTYCPTGGTTVSNTLGPVFHDQVDCQVAKTRFWKAAYFTGTSPQK